MSVVVVGLNGRDAPLELVERLAVADADLPKVLTSLLDSPHLSEAVVVSTCLRTEVYAVAERFHDGLVDIESFFASRLGASDAHVSLLEERLVVDYDDAAARHLFELAAGVDSAVLGEGEILRQVREAGEHARRQRAAGPVLTGLFRHAIEVGKRARSETGIARGTTSLSHVAVDVATKRLGALDGREVLVIGAGEMGEGILEALGRVDGARIVVANRSLARAKVLAARLGGRATPLSQLIGEVAKADVVIAATASEDTLLGVDDVAFALETRGERPLTIIDVAMPRDVDPAVAALRNVTLYDVADLAAFAEQEMEQRRSEVGAVLAIIDEELERYRVDLQARSVAPLVTALRHKAEALRVAEVARHAKRLSEDDAAALDAATRAVIAKLLHDPTVTLKQAAGTARGERLAEALRALFDL